MPDDSPVVRYHDGTKHHFNHFARSLGYLDWASQPRPFRHYEGAPRLPLFPAPDTTAYAGDPTPTRYQQLFNDGIQPASLSAALIGDLLRHSLGLSAWKQAGASRWALRVNPSSGNLHPTEAYIACPALPSIGECPAMYHYAPDAHVLERRVVLEDRAWREVSDGRDLLLVALTSIHWREAWKYGERAFRYCQHDLGHAIGTLTMAARMVGWHCGLLPGWSHAQIAALTGTDRDVDFFEAEREEPACVLALTPRGANIPDGARSGEALAGTLASGAWTGRASQLSEHHVEWSVIDEVAVATRAVPYDIRAGEPVGVSAASVDAEAHGDGPDARALAVRRRSGVAFDGYSSLEASVFFSMLFRLMPETGVPWNTLWWPPAIHLLLFVHRVTGLEPGLYLLPRSVAGGERLSQAIGRDYRPEAVHDRLPLVRLGRGDCRSLARRLSCDQDIAADGFFALGMIAEFDASLSARGHSAYRQLFWESGLVGQMLYLEAEAAGVSGTGIGCFYDDAVHDVLGLKDHAFQSLYHFTVGSAVEDRRLTTSPGYIWEPLNPEPLNR